MPAYVEDTIAAIATAPGAAAIAVLRLSGRGAVEVAGRILRARRGDTPLALGPSHRARLGRLIDPGCGRAVDEVLALPMLAPRSFTGEDVVEIHCHGGRLVPDLALRAALAAGARAARPGEFTERAFLNGRIDLCQAEAVADLIEARSESGLHAAWQQLEGHLSERARECRDEILDARALVEAHLDFPEDDLPPAVETELAQRIGRTRAQVDRLAGTFARGRLARDGVRIALLGKPNVGKSSLMNALLGRERALVSSEPGTTRDYLEEPLALGAQRVLLSDTAGIRTGDSEVERAGVERSRERASLADVTLLVLDGSRPLDAEDRAAARVAAERPSIVVRNKVDLPPCWEGPDAAELVAPRPIDVSARLGTGLDVLCRAIESAVPSTSNGVGEPASEDVLVTRARHHGALAKASEGLGRAAGSLGSGHPLEIVALELHSAALELDRVVGASGVEDVLDRIFSKFCIGK